MTRNASSDYQLGFREEVSRVSLNIAIQKNICLHKSMIQLIAKLSLPVYNDHPWGPKIVSVVDKWSLFRGPFAL